MKSTLNFINFYEKYILISYTQIYFSVINTFSYKFNVMSWKLSSNCVT